MSYSRVLLGSSNTPGQIIVRRIGFADLKDVLVKGINDFTALPTHAIFLCGIYPVIGLLLARLAFGYSVLPLIYPLAMGFALVGPVAALGLYEISRRREQGDAVSLSHVFDALQSSSIGAIAAMGLLLIVIFGVWLAVAHAIYIANFGYAPSDSVAQFVNDIFNTRAGWNLVIIGNAVGFCFAVIVLTISVVSFPLLLDRDVGAAVALWTSIRVVANNPFTIAVWGIIVALLMMLGTLPFFLGLPVVMPVLGHATWHLYRKAVVADSIPRPEPHPYPKGRRYAADFPAALFSWGRHKDNAGP